MIAATCLGVLVVPALYAFVQGIAAKYGKKEKTGEEQTQ
jgi:hypothetical protein